MLLQNEISEKLWDTIQARYQNGDYTGTIRDAFVYLSNIIRDKSDLNGDGVDLINKAFSENNPKIKINRLETTSEKDEQKGIANILRGIYQYIRNPRSHDKYEDTENDCLSIIFFINLLINRIKGSTGQFEIEGFLEQVIDKRFVKSKEYCDALVAEIPERKFFETVLAVYKSKNSIDIYNIQALFKSFYKRMKSSNMEPFLKIVSEELRKTSNDSDIKYIVYILLPEMWEKIDSIGKIRTENRIIESIKDSHFLATWCTVIFKYFSDTGSLFWAAHAIATSTKTKEVEYFYKFIFHTVINLIKKEDIYTEDEENTGFDLHPMFIGEIREKIEKGELIHYESIKEAEYSLPDFLKRYFKSALDEFKEVKQVAEEKTLEDDIPF